MSPSRNDSETTPPCPICHTRFVAVGRQTYCSAACRQAAWRARHNSAGSAWTMPDLPMRSRREVTVYACTDCDQRHLGEQWCQDCVRPCIRVGIGGLCPGCDEPVVVDELLNLHNDDLTAQSRENTTSTKPGAVHHRHDPPHPDRDPRPTGPLRQAMAPADARTLAWQQSYDWAIRRTLAIPLRT